MYDEFFVRDFDVLYKVYEDFVIDFCKLGMWEVLGFKEGYGF